MVRRDALIVTGALLVVVGAAIVALPPFVPSPLAAGVVAAPAGAPVYGRERVVADPDGAREEVRTERYGRPRIAVETPLGLVEVEVAPPSAWPRAPGVGTADPNAWTRATEVAGLPPHAGGYAVQRAVLAGGDAIVLLPGAPQVPVFATAAGVAAGDSAARWFAAGVLMISGLTVAACARAGLVSAR
jgi:hypothetical protein